MNNLNPKIVFMSIFLIMFYFPNLTQKPRFLFRIGTRVSKAEVMVLLLQYTVVKNYCFYERYKDFGNSTTNR